jgi:hypothetical protein
VHRRERIRQPNSTRNIAAFVIGDDRAKPLQGHNERCFCNQAGWGKSFRQGKVNTETKFVAAKVTAFRVFLVFPLLHFRNNALLTLESVPSFRMRL